MITLEGQTILIGGFHDHWVRADDGNPALLLASLNYYHYDFCVLMDGLPACERWQRAAAAFSDRLRLYDGHEKGYGWGHVVTVGHRGAAPRSDDPDYKRVLRSLKDSSAMIFMAHPAYPTTWEQLFKTGILDELIDEGYADGIELTVEGFQKAGSRGAELVAWYRRREQAGHRTPIVGGWDVHLVKTMPNLPSALYTPQRPPDGHYEAPCSNRTLVFAGENTLAAIKEAILAGRSVIEEMPSGALVGPRDLVAFLETHGYRQAIAEMDRQRNALTMEAEQSLVAGQPGRLRLSQGGTLRLPINFESSQIVRASDPTVEIPRVPALLDRDLCYMPVGWQADNGVERLMGVEVTHPIQLDILPWMKDDEVGVGIVPKLPFAGDVQLDIAALGLKINRPISQRTSIVLDRTSVTDLPIAYTLVATNGNGISRRYEGHLTYIGVWRFDPRGDWSKVPVIDVGRREFVPRSAYGLGRPWPGPEVFGAKLQFAWDDQAFRMRATVRDEVHFQPFRGHYAYNADCLQLSLDTMLRRQGSLGDFYSFNLALTSQGPELYRTRSPDNEATDSFTPPPGDVSLGDRFLTITPIDRGLLYELELPWSELAPVCVEQGHRMGVYYIMFNNNGTGHLDTLHWPVPIYGMWTVPRRWGVMTLMGPRESEKCKAKSRHMEPGSLTLT
ncbi:MAG: hypothetical protein WD042_00725 [Phycisphaeraceae bacterium]